MSWDPLVEVLEIRIFEGLWRWISELRAQVQAEGKTFSVYCYNATVEGGSLRRLRRLAGQADQVEELLRSDEWVDMLKVFDSQFITGTGAGLKVVAPLAGYRWPVEDPGGAESMMHHDAAVAAEDEGERDRARDWLLNYNRGDVEATLALRGWLDREGHRIPSIESTADERRTP